MALPAHAFERFLNRVHRRHLFLRAAERTGLGLLGGCVVGVPLVCILLWTDRPAFPLALAALSIGSVAGLAWAVMTRPTRVDAAMEADRQLRWADLLSSALLVRRNSPGDPFAAAVIALADSQCGSVSPSMVLLNRLGARAWGGIGLATALVIVLGLIPTFSSSSRAGDRPITSNVKSSDLTDTGAQRQPSWQRRDRRTPSEGNPDDPDSSHINGAERSATGPEQSVGRSASAAAGKEGTSVLSDGQGDHSSQSDVAHAGRMPGVESGTQARIPGANGKIGTGTGLSSPSGAKATASSAGQRAGVSSQHVPSAPAWQSPDWPAQVERAQREIDSGQIPDSYLDVLRGYFDRP